MPWPKVRNLSVAAVLAVGGLSLGACATNDMDERLAAMDSRLAALEASSADVGQRTDAAARAAETASSTNTQRLDQLTARVERLEQMPPPAARTPRN